MFFKKGKDEFLHAKSKLRYTWVKINVVTLLHKLESNFWLTLIPAIGLGKIEVLTCEVQFVSKTL